MKTKLWRLLALALVLVFVASAFAACVGKDGEPGKDGKDGNGVQTKSVQATIDVFDYFKSAYGLTSNTTGVTASNPDGNYFWRHGYMKNGVDQKEGTNHSNLNCYEYYRHPFKTMAYPELMALLDNKDIANTDTNVVGSSGFYLFFFGGAWEGDKTKTAAQSVTNALAAYYLSGGNGQSVTTSGEGNSYMTNMYTTNNLFYCYNVDFRLSGGVLDNLYDSDIRTDVETFFNGSSNTARSVTYLYSQMIAKLTGLSDVIPEADKDQVTVKSITTNGTGTLTTTTADLIASPSVMLIQKTSTGTATTNTVKNYYKCEGQTQEQVTAAIKNMLDNGKSGGITRADLPVYDYFTDAYRTSSSENNFSPLDPVQLEPTRASGNTTLKRDNRKHRFQLITYAELIALLNTNGNYLIYFGSQWCGYSNGYIRHVDRARETQRFPMIYVVDSTLDSRILTGSHALNIRNNEQPYNTKANGRITSKVGSDGKLEVATSSSYSPFVRLYVEMLKYFGSDFKAYGFTGGDIKMVDETTYTKIGIPGLFIYGKQNVDMWGNSKPIIAFYENDYVFSVIRTKDDHPQAMGLDMILGTIFANFTQGLLTYEVVPQA